MLMRGIGLASANLAAPIIGLLGTPFVARLYSPSAFGDYFFYLSIATLISVVITLQLFNALIAAKSVRRASIILAESLCLTLALNALVYVFWFLFGVVGLFNSDWAVLCCLMALSIGLNQIFSTYLVRLGLIKNLSISLFAKALLLLSVQLLFGFLGYQSAESLALSFAISECVTVAVLALMVAAQIKIGLAISFRKSPLAESRKNIAFALHYMPSQLLSLGVNYSPVVLLKLSGDAIGLGIYSMTLRLVATPINAFSSALRSLYWRWLCRTPTSVSSRTRILYFFGILSAVLICFLAEVAKLPVASVLLGSKWGLVDNYVPSAMLWLLSSFLAVMPAEVLKNTGGQNYILVGEILSASIKLLAVGFGFVFFSTIDLISLWFYAGFVGNLIVSFFYLYKRRFYGRP
ncbi:hypothetical protein ETQ85_23645 [Zoogloea oleivorans]|uniref:Lipopolysaccharide biosynthesis protein n=1 Tax=Zoogloea oleivorans TaxID=1552750 RepID=A0A6C2CEW5_9RHOO|nr:oligosaccharide flippase family protein [Zoogloea oleivorans]TYC51815.1 hypothetical protein ETQ85_23645 [Zoogloea oleivorans]